MIIKIKEQKDGIRIDFKWTSCYAKEWETVFIRNGYTAPKSEIVSEAIKKKISKIKPMRLRF